MLSKGFVTQYTSSRDLSFADASLLCAAGAALKAAAPTAPALGPLLRLPLHQTLPLPASQLASQNGFGFGGGESSVLA